jgi:VanZ family protein
MLSLPHGRLLLVIGWILIMIAIIGSLTPELPSLGFTIGDKLRHFVGYFVLMAWFSGLYPRERHLLLAIAFLLMGAALELLQGVLTVTRDMDLKDLGVNLLGIATAFLLARLGLGNWARRLDR